MRQEQKSLPEEFLSELRELEKSFLTEQDPIRQSGFGGGEKRWRKERELILDAVDGDGEFLDVGCANGYLLQCLMEWGKERGILLTPYGIDQGAGLIELARKRHPHYADHFWVANAWDWEPSRKFRYVYSLYDCVPEPFLFRYVKKLLQRYVKKPGTLIIGAYGSNSRNRPAFDVADFLEKGGFTIVGASDRRELPVSRIAWIKT
jgi:hypothetical protein